MSSRVLADGRLEVRRAAPRARRAGRCTSASSSAANGLPAPSSLKRRRRAAMRGPRADGSAGCPSAAALRAPSVAPALRAPTPSAASSRSGSSSLRGSASGAGGRACAEQGGEAVGADGGQLDEETLAGRVDLQSRLHLARPRRRGCAAPRGAQPLARASRRRASAASSRCALGARRRRPMPRRPPRLVAAAPGPAARLVAEPLALGGEVRLAAAEAPAPRASSSSRRASARPRPTSARRRSSRARSRAAARVGRPAGQAIALARAGADAARRGPRRPARSRRPADRPRRGAGHAPPAPSVRSRASSPRRAASRRGALQEGLLPGLLRDRRSRPRGGRALGSSAMRRARRAASSASRRRGRARASPAAERAARGLGHAPPAPSRAAHGARATAFDILERRAPLEDRGAAAPGGPRRGRRRRCPTRVTRRQPAGSGRADREGGGQVGHPRAARQQPRGVPVRVAAQGARQPAAAGGRDGLRPGAPSGASGPRRAAARRASRRTRTARCLRPGCGRRAASSTTARQDVAEGGLHGHAQLRLDLEAVREATAAALPGQRAQELARRRPRGPAAERLLAGREARGLGPQPGRGLAGRGAQRRLGLGRRPGGAAPASCSAACSRGIRLLAGAAAAEARVAGLRGASRRAVAASSSCVRSRRSLSAARRAARSRSGRQPRPAARASAGALLVGAAGLRAAPRRRRSRPRGAARRSRGPPRRPCRRPAAAAAMRWRASSARAAAADRSSPMRARSRSSASRVARGARLGQLDAPGPPPAPRRGARAGAARSRPGPRGRASSRVAASSASRRAASASSASRRDDARASACRRDSASTPPSRARAASTSAAASSAAGGRARLLLLGLRGQAARLRPQLGEQVADPLQVGLRLGQLRLRRRRRRSCLRMPAASSNSGRRSSGRSASAWSTMPWPMKRKALSARLASSSRSTRSRSRMRWRLRRYSFSPERKSRRDELDLAEVDRQQPVRVVDDEADVGHAHGAAVGAAGEDEVLGAAACAASGPARRAPSAGRRRGCSCRCRWARRRR